MKEKRKKERDGRYVSRDARLYAGNYVSRLESRRNKEQVLELWFFFYMKVGFLHRRWYNSIAD